MVEIARLNAIRTLFPRLQQAGLVTLGGMAVFAFLVYARPLAILPGYLAVVAAFLLWLIVPGWLLQRALFGTRETSIVERVSVAFLVSMALAALPGLVALKLHWSLDTFAVVYGVLASVASGLSLLWHPRGREPPQDDQPAEESSSLLGHVPLLLLIGIPLLAIATSPWWSGDRIARDFDETVYMAFVLDYVNSDGLDAANPLLNTSPGAFGRMQYNVWVVMQALVADSAGVTPYDLLMDYLPPLMTLLVVAAMFTLAKGLFRSTSIALLAAAFVLMYGALDLAPHEGFGRNIFLRVGEDKMVAAFVLMPLGILFSAKMLSAPLGRTSLALLLAMAAIFVTHPMALIFLGLAMISVAVVHLLAERSSAAVRTTALFLLPSAVLLMGYFIWTQQGGERVLLVNPAFRRAFHVFDVTDNLIIANYHLFLHPLLMAAVLLALPVWLASRRSIGNQVLLAMVLGTLVVSFVPQLATAVADATNLQTVFRLHWLIPAPLILAYVSHHVTRRLLAGWRSTRFRPFWMLSLAPVVSVLVVVSAAFLIQEQYARADDGAYYDRTSTTTLLPWTGGSIFLGGVERAFSSDWRPPPGQRRVIDYLEANATPGSNVLANRETMLYFPGMLYDIVRTDYTGPPNFRLRHALGVKFDRGTLSRSALLRAVERYGIDYIVVDGATAPEQFVGLLGSARVLNFGALDNSQAILGQAVQRVYLGSFYADDFLAASGFPILTRYGTAWEQYNAWEFDGEEPGVISLRGGFRIPNDAVAGELMFKLQFTPLVDGPAGTVQWGVWTPSDGDISIGESYDYGPSGAIDEKLYTYSLLEGAGERLEATIITTTDGAFGPGSLVRFAIRRKGESGPDSNQEAAALLQVDVYYLREP